MPPVKRHDPVSRPPLGSTPDDPWTNKDPSLHYIEVHAKAEFHGVDYFLERGYQIETVREHGPKLKGGRARAEGSECSRMGCVLMSRPMDEVLADRAEGQLVADAMDRKMADPLKAESVRSGRGVEVSYLGNNT